MRVCRDLLVGFVGIGLEKSVDVAVCDNNPRIDWVETKVMFAPPTFEPPITQSSVLQKPIIQPAATPPKINIRLISARNLARMSWKKGSTTYIAQTDISSDPTLTARSNTLHPDHLPEPSPDPLSEIPSDYHEFLDVFSAKEADKLPPH